MRTTIPEDALLRRYAVSESGEALPHYTDCFVTTVPLAVNLATYVGAFYKTPLFRSERLVLRLAGMPSKDRDIELLLAGQQTHFAAWTVEDRTEDQLLMCDVNARTRSWFRVVPKREVTDLYFGSAVIANGDELPYSYRVLLGIHRFYSRCLLRAAARRLTRR